MLTVHSAAPEQLAWDHLKVLDGSPQTPSVVNYVDPLDEDRTTDPSITMTHRQLIRLLYLAAETGGRSAREKEAPDPIAWMFSRRGLFGNKAAVEACRGRRNFVRAIILHKLSLRWDADPEAFDELIDDEGDLSCRSAWSNKQSLSVGVVAATG